MGQIELLTEREGGETRLLSPSVGHFTHCAPRGSVLSPGDVAGVIETLSVNHELIVPAGVVGRIVSDPPERVHAPVGFRTTLYTLAPVDAGGAAGDANDAGGTAADGLVFRAPYSGRFWLRPSPNDPAFVSEGDTFEAGATVGLIEVMKTFTHLHYDAGSDLPAKARAVRLLVEDGEEVSQGDPLIEVEAV